MSETEQKPICENGVMKGRRLRNRYLKELKVKVEELKNKYGRVPNLATVLVGDDEGSKMYVRMKHKSCEKIGVASKNIELPATISEEELLKIISDLNADDEITGILVQLPLPKHIDENKIIQAIDPIKDVDGFHPTNVYNLVIGKEDLVAATPKGIIKLLESANVELQGKHVVIINRSMIVGKPLLFLMLNRNATVTMCHSKTKDLKHFTKQADILVTAIGRRKSDDDPFYITEDMVREDAIVIDVATPYGDADFEHLKGKVKCITPVPGGVGPMTIAMLMSNVVRAFELQMERK